MSRRDIEELIKQLQDVAKSCSDGVTLERSTFDEVVTQLGRLEQALDNRPSLIKKLNEKIIKLEGELEILRNATRVNELEKKVQRLEGELQRSYATKNFTLKNGLLEIEKAYRDFISSSPAVQSLWDEITLLLVEDKESLPQHILARRNTLLSRSHDTETAALTDSPLGPHITAESSDAGPNSTLSYVQQQVDKFKDYTFTPGPHDPHDPNHPANLHALYSQHHPFPGATPSVSYGGAPDARAGEAMDDRPMGLDDRMTQIRAKYDDSSGGGPAPALEPHWGSVVPAPSPLRPVSLFSTGGDGRPPDASALEACRDELNASLEHLRALFAQYDWAPTPLPGVAGAAAASAGGQGAPPAEGSAAGQQQEHAQRLPDASAFTTMADSLEVSVQRLRQYFAQFQWVPGAVTGSTGGEGAPGAGGGAVVPDARYFDSQADVILASVQHLRHQFQEAAEAAAAEAAAAAAAAAAGGGGGGHAGPAPSSSTGGGHGASGPAGRSVIPDARYFETQADAIAASVNELLKLYERSASEAATAAANGSASSSQGPWASASVEASAAVSGISRAAVTPDARAGDAGEDEYDASVRPLVDLFSSFLAHLDATRGSTGASGPWPVWLRGGAPSQEGTAPAAASDATLPEAAEAGAAPPAPPPDAAELTRMFTKYARAWPAAAAAALAAAGRGATPRVGSATPGGRAAMSPMGSMTTLVPAGLETVPSAGLRLPAGDGSYADGGAGGGRATSGAALGAAVGATALTSPTPAVRFRIRVNASDASGGAAVTAHLSPAPSGSNLADTGSYLQSQSRPQSHQQRADGEDAGADAVAEPSDAAVARSSRTAGPATPGVSGSGKEAAAASSAAAGAPVDMLLASLEARHGRGLATSPEAVAVWQDLLALLGVDPNSRPLPGTPAARSAPRPPQYLGDAAVGPADGDGVGDGDGDAAASVRALWQHQAEGAAPPGVPGTSFSAAASTTAATASGKTVAAAEPSSAEAADESAAALQPVGAFLAGSGGGGAAAVGSAAAAVPPPHPDGPGGGVQDDAASAGPGTAAEAEEAGADGWRGSRASSSGEQPSTRAAPVDELQGDHGGGGAVANEAVYFGEPTPGALVGVTGEGPLGPDGRTATDGTASTAPLVGTEAEGEAEGERAAGGDGHIAGDGSDDTSARGVAAPEPGGTGDGSLGEEGYVGEVAAAGESDVTAADLAAVDAPPIVTDDGPGLVAGGVRFHITLSEITPSEDPQSPAATTLQQQRAEAEEQQQPQQQLVQFRANVNGVDAEEAAAVAAELQQLRQVRHSLSEQLAATQELVRGLNRQLAVTLENRDDLAVRVESLGQELSSARAEAAEARNESDMFMRELVDAKVQLAEVQGEYMQVYLALKKALGNEKDMIAKIDELERILAVVGPGDVSVDEEYGSTVGQVSSAMITPREGLDDGGGNGEAPTPAAAVASQLQQFVAAERVATPDAASTGGEASAGAAHGSKQGVRGSGDSNRGTSGGGSASGRRSLGDVGGPPVARQSISSGGRSSSGGSGYSVPKSGGSGKS